jgi:hypothetical protein
MDETSVGFGCQGPLAALGQVLGALGVLNGPGQLRERFAFPPITRVLRLQDVGRQWSSIPDADRGVDTAGNKPVTVGAECHDEQPGGVATKGKNLAAGVRVPELDGPFQLEVAIRRPSGLKARPRTSAVWPMSV